MSTLSHSVLGEVVAYDVEFHPYLGEFRAKLFVLRFEAGLSIETDTAGCLGRHDEVAFST